MPHCPSPWAAGLHRVGFAWLAGVGFALPNCSRLALVSRPASLRGQCERLFSNLVAAAATETYRGRQGTSPGGRRGRFWGPTWASLALYYLSRRCSSRPAASASASTRPRRWSRAIALGWAESAWVRSPVFAIWKRFPPPMVFDAEVTFRLGGRALPRPRLLAVARRAVIARGCQRVSGDRGSNSSWRG